MKKNLCAVLAVMSLSAPAFALNQNTFSAHLRKSLALDTRTEIKIASQPTPSGVAGLNVFTAMVGGAPYQVYITKDEKKYFWGFLSDITVDPDKTRMNTLKIQGAHFKGSPNAPVTLVEFSDFQCGHCKNAHDVLKNELYKKYSTDQVRLVFKHFPLGGHDWAEQAAVAAECGASQKEEAFWSMQDFFFGNQPTINKDNVRSKSLEAGKASGLDVNKLDACLDSAPLLEKVRADKKDGTAAGVNSTPYIFINGRPRRGFRDFEDLKVVIDEKLKEIGK